MKTKILLITICICTMFRISQAQEHRIDMSSGKLEIKDINRITLVGHIGSEIIISYAAPEVEERENEREKMAKEPEDEDESEKPDRSKGLRMINAAGQSDNTGLGIHISKNAGVATVTPISTKQKKRYIIQVPKGVNVYYEHNNYNGKLLEIKNINSEIEASLHYNHVKFENVEGPLLIKAVYGKIEGDVSNTGTSLSLHSTYGLVDVALPANGNADVILTTTYGKMYTDFDIETKSTRSDNCAWCAQKMVGSINGGGSEIALSSTYSNIYLRKS